MNIYVVACLYFGFSFLTLGLFVYHRRKDELGGAWFLLSMACGLWGLGFSCQISNSVDYSTALWMSRFADGMALFIPIFWFRFILILMGTPLAKKTYRLLLAVPILLALTVPTPLFIPGMKEKTAINFYYFVHPGPAFHLFTFYFAALVIAGFYLLIRAYFDCHSSAMKKLQIRYLLLATGFGFVGGSTGFLPVYDIDFPIKYATLLLPFFPIFMVLAISRYRFLDVDELARSFQRDKLATIGILATSINHEVRNPLFIIKGLAESYFARRDEGLIASFEERLTKTEEALRKAIDQSNRAMEIVKCFSTFAKEGVEGERRSELVDLKTALEGVLPLIRHELTVEKIELVDKFADDLPPIPADPNHIAQIFFNLILNACQALGEGGKIVIKGEKGEDGVRITVQDNGPGVPAERLSKLFEPFYTTKSEGTGLGLYITKLLTEKNRGKIRIESQEGKGTAFVLEFRV